MRSLAHCILRCKRGDLGFGGGKDERQAQQAPGLLTPEQRTGATGTLFDLGGRLTQEGAQQFLQPSFNTAFNILQPLGQQINPFTQASFRELDRLLPERLAAQEQLFQRQGAFFTPDLQKAQQSIFQDIGQTKEDFLTKLTFGLGQLGANLGQNLFTANIGQQQFGANILDQLLNKQVNQEQFNTGQANQFNMQNLQSTNDLFGTLGGIGAGFGLDFLSGLLPGSRSQSSDKDGIGQQIASQIAQQFILSQLGLPGISF